MKIGYYKHKRYQGKTFAELVHKIAQDEGGENEHNDEQLPDADSSVRPPTQEWMADVQGYTGYKH